MKNEKQDSFGKIPRNKKKTMGSKKAKKKQQKRREKKLKARKKQKKNKSPPQRAKHLKLKKKKKKRPGNLYICWWFHLPLPEIKLHYKIISFQTITQISFGD